MRRRLLLHVVLGVLGLLGPVWALTLGAHPVVMCHDVVMAPGDVCANAEGTRVQTYQERWDAAQQARPVVGVVGAVVAVFAGGWVGAELRASRTSPPVEGLG